LAALNEHLHPEEEEEAPNEATTQIVESLQNSFAFITDFTDHLRERLEEQRDQNT
jgi:hypothetical protein